MTRWEEAKAFRAKYADVMRSLPDLWELRMFGDRRLLEQLKPLIEKVVADAMKPHD